MTLVTKNGNCLQSEQVTFLGKTTVLTVDIYKYEEWSSHRRTDILREVEIEIYSQMSHNYILLLIHQFL